MYPLLDMLPQPVIDKLIGMGGKEWAVDQRYRIYLSPELLGAVFCFSGLYLTGGRFQGRSLSAFEARELKKARTFIDVLHGGIPYSTNVVLQECAEDLIEKLTRQGDEARNYLNRL